MVNLKMIIEVQPSEFSDGFMNMRVETFYKVHKKSVKKVLPVFLSAGVLEATFEMAKKDLIQAWQLEEKVNE